MEKEMVPRIEKKSLEQLAQEQLIELVIRQAGTIEQQAGTIEQQAGTIERLGKRIEELEREVEKIKVSRDLDSQNSSKPPATDIYKKSEQKKEEGQGERPDLGEEEEKPKRKPGGQPGHEGKTRKGFGRVDRWEVLRPEVCECCGQAEFKERAVKVEKQQVAHLVERPIEIVEYEHQTCECSQCGNWQASEWPATIVPGQDLGVKLQALLGWLNNYGHLPYEKQQELLWELGEIEVGVGTLVATNERIEVAVNPSVKALQVWIQQEQPNIHVDETPWVVKGVKEWLWIFALPCFALFHAADSRSRAELEAVLGLSYKGVLSSDDYAVYNGYAVKAQQKCLAHLRRHLKKLRQLLGLHNQAIGKHFLNLVDEALFTLRQCLLLQRSKLC